MKSHIVPVWKNKAAPCGGPGGCPAYTNIAASLHALSLGDVRSAWKIMMATHPLRSVLGRVCYGFCEAPCNRGEFDTPISIQMLEAVIGDYGSYKTWRPDMKPENGKKVLIVGGGPAGLAGGWLLAVNGFRADIYESQKKPGGVLQYGIPDYRLPKGALEKEIKLIEKLGVHIHCDSPMNEKKLLSLLDDGAYDAAIVAVGAGASRKAHFPGEQNAVEGIKLLKDIKTGVLKGDEFTGKSVVVIGGGNVAMDSCRSVIRLGAKSVKVVYRRSEDMMPAHKNEVREAREEGVEILLHLSPLKYDGKRFTMQIMALGEPDESGRRSPVGTGGAEDIEADILVTALGQEPSPWKRDKRKNIFFAGDVSADSRGTVIHAIASGKDAANRISELLIGEKLFDEPGETVTYDKMNINRYFEPQMRTRNYVEPIKLRKKSFDTVDKIVSLGEGILEAKRCFRCGVCIGGLNTDCDWCFRACDSDKSIIKLNEPWNEDGPFYKMGDNCDSCSRCWEDCPRYVVTPMEVESEYDGN